MGLLLELSPEPKSVIRSGLNQVLSQRPVAWVTVAIHVGLGQPSSDFCPAISDFPRTPPCPLLLSKDTRLYVQVNVLFPAPASPASLFMALLQGPSPLYPTLLPPAAPGPPPASGLGVRQ